VQTATFGSKWEYSQGIHSATYHSMHDELETKLCRSSPGYHAFTGCDYTASFSKRGKTRPFNVLRKHGKFQELFYNLGMVNELAESSVKDVEEFVCLIYGRKKKLQTSMK